jgi:hypothetical protein
MRNFLFVLLFGQCSLIYSQNQLGLRLENYAGVGALSLNPAGNLVNPLQWDVTLAAAGVFFETNYGYLMHTNTLDLFRHRGDAQFRLAKDVEGPVAENVFLLEFRDDERQRYGRVSTFLAGPSFAFKLKEKHSIGVFSGVRFEASAFDVPYDFSYYEYDRKQYYVPFRATPFYGAMMSWWEIGLNYALKTENSAGFFGVGANLRVLQALEGGYVENLVTFDFTRLPNYNFTLGQPAGRFGFTDSNLKSEGNGLTNNGLGFGLDVGVLQVFEGNDDPYHWRLGASLLDLGYLHFTNNAQTHAISVDSTATVFVDDYRGVKGIDEFEKYVQVLSAQTLSDSLASRESNAFTLALPAAFSLQSDHAFSENFFLNALLVQGLPAKNLTARRGSLLAVTPRFEHRWFSASLPVSLNNWQSVRVGFAARLGFLILGTDDFGGLFGQGNYNGTDFYIALKINPFNIGGGLFEGFGGVARRRYGGKGKVKCYDF